MSEKVEKTKDTETKTNDAKKTEEKVKKIIIEHTFKTTPPEKVPEKVVEKPEKPAEKPDKDAEKSPPDKPKKKDEKVVTPPEKVDDSEVKKLTEKLQEREAQIATIVLKAFEDEKKAFLDQIKDEKKRKSAEEIIGDDPDKLEDTKRWFAILKGAYEKAGVVVEGTKPEGKDDKTGTKDGKDAEAKDGKKEGDDKDDENPEDVGVVPPKGIAGLPTTTGTKDSQEKIISELFAILKNPAQDPATMKAKEEASRKVEAWYKSLYAGRKKGILEGRKDYGYAMVMCPKCSKIIMGRRDEEIRSCPHCKTVFTKRR